MSHPFGQPLNVIKFNDATSVEFNKEDLDGLLLHPEVKNRKVVIMSIVGAFRKGKSFFMDYCLRFLYANVSVLFLESFKILNLVESVDHSVIFCSTSRLRTPTTNWTTKTIGWVALKNPWVDFLGDRARHVKQRELYSGPTFSFTTTQMARRSRSSWLIRKDFSTTKRRPPKTQESSR